MTDVDATTVRPRQLWQTRAMAPLALLAGMWLMGTGPSARGDVLLDLYGRGVEIVATTVPQQVHVSAATGHYVQTVTGFGTDPPFSFLSVSASQDSTIPDGVGPAMSGQGTALTDLSDTDADFSLLAESTFNVMFHVSTSTQYTFAASVSWQGTEFPLFGESRVELWDDTNGVLLGQALTIGYGVDTEASLVTLSPGVQYSLSALAKVVGADNVNTPLGARADWSFNLATVAIPEAGGAWLMAAAAAAVGAVRALRRRRGIT